MGKKARKENEEQDELEAAEAEHAEKLVEMEEEAEEAEDEEDGVELINAEQKEIHAAILRLGKDLKKYSLTMPDREARALVSEYYIFQENRKREDNQILALERAKEPHSAISQLSDINTTAENVVRGALGMYVSNKPLCQWAMSVCGIGPIFAAALYAWFDIKGHSTVGQLWRFAGLDPTRKWYSGDQAKKLVADTLGKCSDPLTDEQVTCVAMAAHTKLDKLKGMRWAKLVDKDNPTRILKSGKESPNYKMQRVDFSVPFTKAVLVTVLSRRPYNAELLTLCWKIGESFVKVSKKDEDVYGKMYIARKVYETDMNEKLAYKAQAEQILLDKPTHAQRAILKTGKLSLGHIHSRAKRHAVKIFLAHYHEMGRKLLGLPVPAPWIIEHGGHAHKTEPQVNTPEPKVDKPVLKDNSNPEAGAAVKAA